MVKKIRVPPQDFTTDKLGAKRCAGLASETAGQRTESERDPICDRDRYRILAAELTIAEERERRRIASGLHDQVGQLLGIAKIKLGEALAARPSEEVAGPASEARRLVDRAIHEIRDLTFELSSPVLHELGLEAALAELAERMETRHGIPCRFEQPTRLTALPEALAVLLHSIVRELLWNAVKHAHARRVMLAIGSDGDHLRIVVQDDGAGFDPTQAFNRSSEKSGLGLFSARERLHYLDGTLEIDSAPERGTRIVLTVPNRP